jgi:hypothetical protein
MLRPLLFAVASSSLIAFSALAQTPGGGSGQGGQGQGGPGGGHRGPPPEAIAACQGKAAGTACNFVGRQNEPLTGTCFQPPPRSDGQQSGQQGGASGQSGQSGQRTPPMACRPDRGGPQGQGKTQGQGQPQK